MSYYPLGKTSTFRFLPIFLTFLGDFNHQKLPLTRLRGHWEQKNRVLLEEYYIFNVANFSEKVRMELDETYSKGPDDRPGP